MSAAPEEIVLRVVVDTSEARSEIERMVSTLLDADHLDAIEGGALRLSDVLRGSSKLLEVLAARANRAAKELRGEGEG